MEGIIFENINDKFGYGEYLGLKVIIMKKNGYINASKMLKDISDEIGKDKNMTDWKRTEHTQELIKSFEEPDPSIPGSGPIIKFTNSNKEEIQLQGHYVHPDLIVHIASWASPKFARKVSKIVNEYIVNEHKKQIKKLKKERNELNKEVKTRDNLLNIMKEYIIIFKTDTENNYYVARVSKQKRSQALKTAKKRNYEKIMEIEIAKNSVAVFNKLTKYSDNIDRKGNLISLNGITIEQFISEINKLVSI